MAAPIEAYHTEELHTTDTVVVNSYPIAKFTDSVAVLKSRFYLDWLLRISEGANEEWGFIGGCTNGSVNANMHSRGVMTFKGGNEVYYIDAGLNTKAKGTSIFSQLEGGALGVNVTPAYYSTSHSIRLFWRLSPSSSPYNVTSWKPVSHPDGQSIVTTYFGATEFSLPTGVLLEVYAEVQNDEGTTTTTTYEVSIGSDNVPVDVTIFLVEPAPGGAWLTIHTDVVLQANITYYLTWNNGMEGSNDNTMYSGNNSHQAWMPDFDSSINNLISMFSLEPNPPHTDIEVVNTPYMYSPPSVYGRLDVKEIISSPNYFRFAMTDPADNIIHFVGSILITMKVQWYNSSMVGITQTDVDVEIRGAGSIETSASFYAMGTDTPSNYIYWSFVSVVNSRGNTVISFTNGTYRIGGR